MPAACAGGRLRSGKASVHGRIEWFARNGVAANLMRVFIVANGLLAATSANEGVFPEMKLDRSA